MSPISATNTPAANTDRDKLAEQFDLELQCGDDPPSPASSWSSGGGPSPPSCVPGCP
jgi:hypothetical protein